MNLLQKILKDWCLNRWEFTEDISQESLIIINDYLDNCEDKKDQSVLQQKVELFMKKWIENDSNIRMDILLESNLFYLNEKLDELLKESF